MTRNDIINAAKPFSDVCKWGLYRAAPGVHRFCTFNIPERKFDGADMCAFYRHIVLEVTFFFREDKTPGDLESEAAFEKAVSFCGEYSAHSGYDETSDCYYTQYVFKLTEEI